MTEHIDNILSSDLLERYVLGDVTPEEVQKVELLRIDHRVIRERLSDLEKTMEKSALENAVSAPAGTKECIMKSISGKNISDTTESSPAPKSVNQWWKYLATVAVAALAIWMVMRYQIQDRDVTIEEQEAEIAQLHKDCDKLNEIYAYINHGGTMPYLLDGSAFGKESQVIVYWNEQLRQSMLKVIELPGIQADQTYQLWADVDGHMLSLGTFDAGLAVSDAIPMNYLDEATSLNITVEPKGGSEHPTVSTLAANITI